MDPLRLISVITGISSLIGNLIVGLIVWAGKAEVRALDAKMDTMRAEHRAALAEAGMDFYKNVNSKYVATPVFQSELNAIRARLDKVENDVDEVQ